MPKKHAFAAARKTEKEVGSKEVGSKEARTPGKHEFLVVAAGPVAVKTGGKEAGRKESAKTGELFQSLTDLIGLLGGG